MGQDSTHGGSCAKMVGKKTSSMGTSKLEIVAQYAIEA